MWMTCLLLVVMTMIASTKNMLNSRFDIKDMGLDDVILGIKIKRTPEELILSQ